MKYAFIGHASRCPASVAAQFVAPDGSMLPGPNLNWAADAMASTFAAVVSATVTNPLHTAWFDKFGLENATKCKGTFGQTYLTNNNARANLRLGQRDYLLQQNWVNDRKGRCGLSYR